MKLILPFIWKTVSKIAQHNSRQFLPQIQPHSQLESNLDIEKCCQDKCHVATPDALLLSSPPLGPRHDICRDLYATGILRTTNLRKKRVNHDSREFTRKLRKCLNFTTNPIFFIKVAQHF